MKTFVTHLVVLFAKRIIKKYRPIIIGITGSVGKTSAKEAIALALRSHTCVRASVGNFNTEIGVPLVVIGIDQSPGRSLLAWLGALVQAVRLIVVRDPSYPRVLILEMGADRPGDISYLTQLAPCTIGAITAIGPAHLEKFGTMEVLVKEKKEMVRHLSAESTAIINADDPFLYPPSEHVRARLLTFGFSSNADLRITSYIDRYVYMPPEHMEMSISFECRFSDQTVECELQNAVGKQSAYAALVGLATACALDIPLKQAVQDVREYVGPKGRMKLLGGMKQTLIIDDSYNSSPLAAYEALTFMESIRIHEYARRIAVFGDMLELGTFTEQEHRKLGELCVQKGVDILVTIGSAAKWIADGAAESGIDTSRIFRFDRTEEVHEVLLDTMKQGDVVLVKGSQGMRLEKIVKEILNEPERASELLVRQGKEWQ
ncbi:MAG: UDP-N-acetylmuramoyl-tripeptide--D-alanyl-D-alanine ligase [Patescibacteria group bacterium]